MEALPFPLSSREPVTFSIFSRFCTRPDVFQSPPKRRHPERSASQIYRITEGFMARSRRTPAMLVGRCSSGLSGHRLQGNLKSHRLRAQPRACPERSRRGSAVPRTFPGNVFNRAQRSAFAVPQARPENIFRGTMAMPRRPSAIPLWTGKLMLVVPVLWGYSSAGRAPRSQRGGQRFDPA